MRSKNCMSALSTEVPDISRSKNVEGIQKRRARAKRFFKVWVYWIKTADKTKRAAGLGAKSKMRSVKKPGRMIYAGRYCTRLNLDNSYPPLTVSYRARAGFCVVKWLVLLGTHLLFIAEPIKLSDWNMSVRIKVGQTHWNKRGPRATSNRS